VSGLLGSVMLSGRFKVFGCMTCLILLLLLSLLIRFVLLLSLVVVECGGYRIDANGSNDKEDVVMCGLWFRVDDISFDEEDASLV
jgi:hypothetical protein